MVLRKIKIDKSVGYIPKGEQTREIKQSTICNKSTPGIQNKNTSQNGNKFLENVAAKGFGIFK